MNLRILCVGGVIAFSQLLVASPAQALLVGTLERVSPLPTGYQSGVDFATAGEPTPLMAGDVTASLFYVTGTGAFATDFVGFPAGSIALIERGGTFFSTKVNNAAAAGAAGVLIFSNSPGLVFPSAFLSNPTTIPVLFLTQELGQELVSLSTAGVVMHMTVEGVPDPIPEPMTAGLAAMSCGALALASLRRRRA